MKKQSFFSRDTRPSSARYRWLVGDEGLRTGCGLEPATAATALLPGGVGGDGGHILDAADLHAGAGQGAEGRLGTWRNGQHTLIKCIHGFVTEMDEPCYEEVQYADNDKKRWH